MFYTWILSGRLIGWRPSSNHDLCVDDSFFYHWGPPSRVWLSSSYGWYFGLGLTAVVLVEAPGLGVGDSEFRKPEHSQELLRIHVKPLPKKAGDRDIRPISLIETTFKLIDKTFLPKLRLWASTHTPVLPEQYGFRTGVSAGD